MPSIGTSFASTAVGAECEMRGSSSRCSRDRLRSGYEPSCDIASLAAAYAYGLARNHGFVDGNKRVAFLALYVFLGLNGFSFDASEEEVVAVINDLASGRIAEDELAVWVRQNASAGRP